VKPALRATGREERMRRFRTQNRRSAHAHRLPTHAQVKGTIEAKFQSVWVAGEVSNFTRASSGHWYFTLKDANAQIKTVAFRRHQPATPLRPEERHGGIIARGRLTVYDPGRIPVRRRGASAEGRLGGAELALRQLRQKLLAKGYFSPDRKRPLPRAAAARGGSSPAPPGPRARHDRSLRPAVVRSRKWSSGRRACRVKAGAKKFRSAVRQLNWLHWNNKFGLRRGSSSAAGGGSAEDLWAFQRGASRTRSQFAVPVVSAVGTKST